jgi:16S rRNA (guanine1207-N2)-methyltransferase
MGDSRVSLALAAGAIALPETGRIAVFRARVGHDLGALPKDRVEIIQGFYPEFRAFQAQGFAVAVQAAGDYAAALVYLPRAKAEAHALIAQAAALVAGGPVIVDGQKTDGIQSVLRDCRRTGAEVGEVFAKAHGKIFSLRGGDFSGWAAGGDNVIKGGFHTRAGVFSADGVDRGSALLAAAIAGKLKGRVCDLGAGWGYLARAVLQQTAVSECHLVEAEHAALECARLNITDDRARFHWDDALAFRTDRRFDHIVTNPPFHTGRAADVDLGRGFISASARLCARHGTVWLVANRHLPYEQDLSAAFKQVDEIAGDASFKVFRAAKPRPA